MDIQFYFDQVNLDPLIYCEFGLYDSATFEDTRINSFGFFDQFSI